MRMSRIVRRSLIGCVVCLSCVSGRGVRADGPTSQPASEVARDAAIASAVAPALVQVEYTLQVDNGEQPYGGAMGQRCPNCGQFHNNDLSNVVTQERPLETVGFAVAADEVVAPDSLIQDRFIKSIAIRVGETVVPAKITRVFTDRRAILLKAERPLDGVKPLAFTTADGPYVAVVPTQVAGRWRYQMKSFGLSRVVDGDEKRIVDLDNAGVIVAADGKPVTIGFAHAVRDDDAWKAAPATWNGLGVDDLSKKLDTLKADALQGIVRVHLSFRSPRNTNEEANQYRFNSRNEEDAATERDVIGVVLAPDRVMVLADLKQDQTARLERITIYAEGAKAVPATFVSSYKDQAALLVAPQQPMEKPVVLAEPKSASALKDQMLLALEVAYNGEQRLTYADHRWVNDVNVGWRRQLVPVPAGESKRPLFLFDADGKLLTVPIALRDTTPDDYNTPDVTQILVDYLKPMATKPAEFADAANVPLNEADELRTAWLGVEMQSLTQELARLNKVSELTSDGASGGLVTFVYPDSPAAKMGITPGAILLRLYTPDRPTPIEVKVDRDRFADQPFPWERLSELPEQYFDRVPRPWSSPQTALSKELTKVGFGRTVELEYVQNGKSTRSAITIEQSPAHFDTARRFDHKASGLSLRDMTYELRRFFQIDAAAPGVIIAMIDAGSRASRVGLKPLEYITSVNGVDVHNVDEFQKAVAGGGELKLGVKRFRTGRVVTLKVDAPSTKPTTLSTTPPATLPAEATQPATGPASSATKPWSAPPAN